MNKRLELIRELGLAMAYSDKNKRGEVREELFELMQEENGKKIKDDGTVVPLE